ncbi:ribosome biogenesis protein BMS1 homolog [Lineus longissimus]|uniref:ribosome biogenesis protein BMS1 homolog n=1 Tax=Lineus longissimus TaxID=88925 RepID=UPI002B4D3290
MEEDSSRKGHRKRHAGPKAEKKKAKNKHEQDLTARQRNPKAFAIQSVNKTERLVRRSLDVQVKKHHIPVVDRTPLEPPPICVAIVGPPKVGKTTLMNCLIKSFTKTKLSNIQGPVTIVSGKKRRITFIECNNDINAMIDIAKIADLVLLLVDASFGFEMETFEFLNICQVHGFPKIMGVLTHLDMFRNNKHLRKTKKRLKHRFWTEIYQGAKLFYLSGMVNGEYQKTEIHNLGRFISVMKFRPLQWRTTHPYIIADRYEDVTDPEAIRQDAKCDRKICLYGYVRGTHFKNHSSVHIPGCGDFSIKDMSFLPDPCPLPQAMKKRNLNEKERLIYAPMSGVGGIVYDKDAVYIDLGGSHHTEKEHQKSNRPADELMTSLIGAKQPLDYKMAASEVSLFSNTAPLKAEDVDMSNTDMPSEEQVFSNGRVRRRALPGDDVEDSGNEEEEGSDSDSEDDESGDDDDDNDDDDDDEGEYTIEPQAKKSKKEEELVFADSDDDLEDGLDLHSPSVKKRTTVVVDMRSSDENEDRDDDDESSDGDDDSDSDAVDKSDGDSSENSDDEHPAKTVKEKGKLKSKPGSNSMTIVSKVGDVYKKDTEAESDDSEEDEDENSGDESEYSRDKDQSSDEGMDTGGDSGFNVHEESDESGDEDSQLRWKDNLAGKASDAFHRRQMSTTNWRKMVYGKESTDQEEKDDENNDIGGLFKLPKKVNKKPKGSVDGLDTTKHHAASLQESDLEEVRELIKDCFVTGKWDKSEDAKTLLDADADDEVYGDFEDLETGEVHEGKDSESSEEEKEEPKKDEIPLTREEARAKKIQEKRLERKRKLKTMFDSEYDEAEGSSSYFDELKASLNEQAQLNKGEFEALDDTLRVQYEGFRPGMYARVEIDSMPCEFITNFDATYPVILGGLLNVEETIGLLQVRFKKHRWHKKILKTRDPLIVSLGWRRFQTIPLYTIQDHNMRNRLLKYTPEHLHCHAALWGPMTPQNTGILAVQTVSGGVPGFRIAATGVVLELDKSFTIVKKLKLTGTPQKIYKKTAFIEGMFNSNLEVSKFEGAGVRTVSGIRGMIKKAAKVPPGAFRATFEDKILLSDIVFLRTWYQIQVPNFYNPVTTMLLPKDLKNQWQGMKTTGQLRREKGVKGNYNPDSLYKPIERREKTFRPLSIPNALQRNLPFKDKPKIPSKAVDLVQSQRVAVIREPKERKVAQLMKMLKTLNTQKIKQRRAEMKQRVGKHKKEMAKIEKTREEKLKEGKKELFRELGKLEQKKRRMRKD